MLEYVQENWLALVGVLLAAVALFKAIAKATPTDKDDKVAAKLDSILGFLKPGDE